MEDSVLRTRSSLLARLGQDPADQGAWNEFATRYGPRIGGWCRAWGLQTADVEDVVQTVLLNLAARMRSFVYDPGRSFRAWLKTLTQHAWSDFISQRQRGGRGTGAVPGDDPLGTLPARDDLQARLAEAFDLELLELATARVRERVAANTWEAFRLTALEELSGAEAGVRLGMQVAAVFKAKSNVQKLLQEELRTLEGGSAP
jgi:RNA polymerase sigma-70 factor (ECF subfamily)